MKKIGFLVIEDSIYPLWNYGNERVKLIAELIMKING